MGVMKRFLVLLSCSGALLCGADLSGVHSVYMMPMARGLEQYLANRLTNEHVFSVVTDPKMADAVFTDRIGQGFQTQWENLNPPPPTKPAAKAEKAAKAEEQAPSPLPTETVNKLDNPSLNSGFGRARGNVFLVDAKSRQVLWSVFEPAKDSTTKELDRTASDIVSRLRKDLGLEKK